MPAGADEFGPFGPGWHPVLGGGVIEGVDYRPGESFVGVPTGPAEDPFTGQPTLIGEGYTGPSPSVNISGGTGSIDPMSAATGSYNLSNLSVVCQKPLSLLATQPGRVAKCIASGLLTSSGAPTPLLQQIVAGGGAGLPPATIQGQSVPAGTNPATIGAAGTSITSGISSTTWILIFVVGAFFLFKK